MSNSHLVDLEMVEKIKGMEHELVSSFSDTFRKACDELGVDLRCLDWFSYNPDFYIEQMRNHKAQKAA